MERTPKGQCLQMKRAAMAALSVSDVACALDYMECAKDVEMAMVKEQSESIKRAKRRLADGVLAHNVGSASIALNGDGAYARS
jgi:dihydroneopterin aldolase